MCALPATEKYIFLSRSYAMLASLLELVSSLPGMLHPPLFVEMPSGNPSPAGVQKNPSPKPGSNSSQSLLDGS